MKNRDTNILKLFMQIITDARREVNDFEDTYEI